LSRTVNVTVTSNDVVPLERPHVNVGRTLWPDAGMLFIGALKSQLNVKGAWPPLVEPMNSQLTWASEGATHGVLSARHAAVNATGAIVVVVVLATVVVATEEVVVVLVTVSLPPHAVNDKSPPSATASPVFVIIVSSATRHAPRPVPCP
jgi:hypothetical protein